MRTTSTKIIIGLSGILFATGSLQAQSATPVVNQTSAISLISNNTSTTETPSASHLWGYTFGDYAFVAHGDSAGRGTSIQYKGLGSRTPTNAGQNQNAFEIRRAYLGYDYKINSKFYGTALLAYEGDYDVNGNRTVYLKEAYFGWKNFLKGTDLKIGQQATNSYSDAYNTVALNGYRAIERSIMDMHKAESSSDMGVSLEGRVWTYKSADTTKPPTFIGYNIMIGDNSGNTPVPVFTNAGTAANTTTDKDKKYSANTYVNTLAGALTIGVYGDLINYGGISYKTSKLYQNATYTAKVYAAYNVKAFGIGFEWFEQINTNGEIEVWKKGEGTSDTTNAIQSGLSVFAHVTIVPNKLNVFGRYDIYNPDATYSYNVNKYTSLDRLQPEPLPNSALPISAANSYGPTWKETFISAGLDWTPTTDKKVHFIPNIWYYRINNAYGSDALKSDYYAVYRLTFLYIFK